LRLDQLDEACRNLVVANIFKQEGKQYSFRLPLFARMLADHYELDYMFEQARREATATAR